MTLNSSVVVLIMTMMTLNSSGANNEMILSLTAICAATVDFLCLFVPDLLCS